MKPTKTFKMLKQTKRFAALIINAHERGAFKRAMIDAQLASQQIVRSKKES